MKKLSLVLVLMFALAAGFAQTAIPFEATYTFGADGNVTSFAYNGTQYPGISMGSIEKKYLTSVSSDGNFRAEGWPNGISSPRIVFTISAVPGYKYTVNSITFGLGRTATGATRALWRGGTSYSANINNYTSLHGNITNDNGKLSLPNQAGGWTGNVLSLVGIDGYQDLTTECEFRLFMYGASGEAGLEGPLTITGTYTLIDPTLPVTLSHFSAALTAQNYVQLTWISQSESNLMGYNVYRSTNEELSSAVQICPMIAGTNTSMAQTYTYYDKELVEDGTYYYWLQSVDLDGTTGFHGPVSVVFSINGDEGAPSIPTATKLDNAYPNPFNPNTTIRYQLKDPGKVKIDIYNLKGHPVRSFRRLHDAAGRYSIVWDGCDSSGNSLPSGVYLYKMSSGSYSAIKKLVLQK